MASPAFGLQVPIDGPAPLPPALTLLGSSHKVDDGNDRWINGAAIWPYPRYMPDVFDPCQPGSSAGHTKDAGAATDPSETFGAYNVLEPISCTTRGGMSAAPEEFKRRASVALAAYEHWAIEREFWTSALKPDNPHLAQVAGTTQLNSGTAISVKNAVAALEQAIADLGGTGVIHMRPLVFSQLVYEAPKWLEVDNGVARTRQGNIVIPGVGYTGTGPSGAAPTGTTEWIYATGLIDYRKSAPVMLPESLAEATDRAQNFATFRAEEYVLLTWDQRIHVAVKVDRALTTITF